jgi:Mg2+/Co2+ transporter CorC
VWHQEVALAEPVVRFILGQLDGTRTVTDLTRLVRDHEQIQLSAAETSDVVEGALQLLARAALLIG